MSFQFLKSIVRFFLLTLIITCFFTPQTNSEKITRIIALVNGKAITQSDFQNRAKFIKSNNQELNDAIVSNRALDELINEAIKISAAEELGLTYFEEDIRDNLNKQLQSQGTSLEEYSLLLKSNQINPQIIIDQRIAATLWNQYILRKYRRIADITKDDIKDYKRQLIEKEDFHIQFLKFNNSSNTENLNIAQTIVSEFESCAKNLILYKDNDNILIEDNFSVKLSNLSEPYASLLRYKFDQFILPIQSLNNEITLMINCTPKKILSDFEIENELISDQLEFYAEKELRNLRQDSLIDFKS